MKKVACLIFLFSVIVSNFAFSEEHFGKFSDPLEGIFIDKRPRPVFKLTKEFSFEDPNGLIWKVPASTEVDGASIPQALWSLIGGPFEGLYIKASVIHDYYCDEKIRTEHDTHRDFYYGMRAAGVEIWKAKFMYWAVATYGPQWKIEKRINQKLSCKEVNGKLNCNQIPELISVVVAQTTIDLNDPDNLAAAVSKASAIARTLKTTDGKVLDITESGQIKASLDEIAINAAKYHAVFTTKNYMNSPSDLGVLSQWNAVRLDKVKSWENDKLPKFQNSIVLKTDSLEKINSGKDFRLDEHSKDLLQGQIKLKFLEMKSEQ